MKFETVSVDEVIGKRKQFANDNGVLFKAHTKAASFNEEDGSAKFIMSAEIEDRMGDIVVQRGIDLEAFNSNPIAFFNHRSFDTPIGQWSGVKVVNGSPKRTEGTMKFVEEGLDDTADRVRGHVKGGTIRAASIGFIPKLAERILDDDGNKTFGYRFPEIELTECSVVCVPAVREALMRSAGGEEVDIQSLEVIEDFLDNLKNYPALAAEVNPEHFEAVLKAAYGNKTHFVIDKSVEDKKAEDLKLNIDTSEISGTLEKMQGIVNEFSGLVEKAEGIKRSAQADNDIINTDPHLDDVKGTLEKAAEDITKTLDELPEDDSEKRSLVQGMIDGLKALFAPEKQPEPVLASSEDKDALKKRLEEIQARNKAA